jgi:hypothetical protein
MQKLQGSSRRRSLKCLGEARARQQEGQGNPHQPSYRNNPKQLPHQEQADPSKSCAQQVELCDCHLWTLLHLLCASSCVMQPLYICITEPLDPGAPQLSTNHFNRQPLKPWIHVYQPYEPVRTCQPLALLHSLCTSSPSRSSTSVFTRPRSSGASSGSSASQLGSAYSRTCRSLVQGSDDHSHTRHKGQDTRRWQLS